MEGFNSEPNKKASANAFACFARSRHRIAAGGEGHGKTRDAKLALGAQNKGSGKNPRFRGANGNVWRI